MLPDFASVLAMPALNDYLSEVETLMREIVAPASHVLRESAGRAISGGKRMRPILTIASAASRGGEISPQVIMAAAAVELAHVGTIVHDDVIDKSGLRWGEPTVNAHYGSDQAILVGDYLLALAASQAARVSPDVASTLAMTVAEMCDGQALECADQFNVDRTMANYLEVARKKTAALTSAACRIGGLCAGLSADLVAGLATYGESFGMAFQLTDDILDLVSTQAAMGKPVGNDLKEGVYTLPIIQALGGGHGADVKRWLGARPAHVPTRLEVAQTLSDDGAIAGCYRRADDYNQAATKAMEQIGTTEVARGLAELPHAYLRWARQKSTILVDR